MAHICRLTYTVEEAGALIGVSRSTMYELVRSGEVASVRVGARRFVTAPTIEAITGVTPPPPSALHTHSSTSNGVAAVYVVETHR
jgi:excisionase family DNA binding protein